MSSDRGDPAIPKDQLPSTFRANDIKYGGTDDIRYGGNAADDLKPGSIKNDSMFQNEGKGISIDPPSGQTKEHPKVKEDKTSHINEIMDNQFY